MNRSRAEGSRVNFFTELDLQFARFLARISGDSSPELLFAAALVSNARGRGNICIDLSSDIDKEGAPFAAAALMTVLAKSPAVTLPIPEAAPVTNATLPRIPVLILNLHLAYGLFAKIHRCCFLPSPEQDLPHPSAP